MQGYRAASKHAVRFLEEFATGLNDPSAAAVMRVAALDRGIAMKAKAKKMTEAKQ